MATGVLMGWRYGVKRIMSSYDFTNENQGPPTQSLPEDWFNATILPPTTSAGSSDLGEFQAEIVNYLNCSKINLIFRQYHLRLKSRCLFWVR